MPYVLTVDQQGSRRTPDRGADLLGRLTDGVPTVRPFERTAGEEFQGVLADPVVVVDLVLRLVREGGWSIGVGAGTVQAPLPDSTRAGAGAAYLCARRAVDAARQRGVRLAVRGAVPPDAGDAQAVLSALAVVVQRRSAPAWEAIELVGAGCTQAAAAAALGVSRQAVGQRLTAGLWELERELRPTAARLLTRAAG
ncbi:hypothetical protein [Geodermatophilus poikilotrophus]|uniref:SatD family (SatD) n=1 Tax=Geodermatophilus poikilotrophus TaxID=1333667 RepID=A0A1H9ZUB1_9ACTN|nr:hypothetical protein [Geodermatophilus poikilotrophus]SES85349.1 hypothetical protein SAMN04488546_0783 [Geodermatophilus poikilotrophus]